MYSGCKQRYNITLHLLMGEAERLSFSTILQRRIGSHKMMPSQKRSTEATSRDLRAWWAGCVPLALQYILLGSAFLHPVCISLEDYKMSRAKMVRWLEEDITTRKTTSNCSASRVYLSVVGFFFIARENTWEPPQIPVLTVVLCSEWPVKSQWSKWKWNGADSGNCQESWGYTSLHDQILTRKSQKARNLSCPGELAARTRARRQDMSSGQTL